LAVSVTGSGLSGHDLGLEGRVGRQYAMGGLTPNRVLWYFTVPSKKLFALPIPEWVAVPTKKQQKKNQATLQPRAALKTLLGSLSSKTFFNDYWESKSVLLRGADTGSASLLVTIDNLEEIISYASIHNAQQNLRFVRSEHGKISNHPTPVDSKGHLDIFQIYRLYFEGWTIIVNGVQRLWRPVRDFSVQLEEEIGHTIGVNLYFTPGQSQGFLPHVDGHDVFILQTQGSKTWEVYDSPTALPLEHQNTVINEAQLGDATLSTELTAGQALYIPRGWIHRAFTSKESSIHLTLGIHADHWSDLVREVVKFTEDHDVELRKALPNGILDSPRGRKKAQSILRELLLKVADNTAEESVFCDFRKKRLKEQPWPIVGQFANIDRLEEITLDTVVERRGDLQCLIDETETDVSINYLGNVVRGPKSISSAFKYVAMQKRFATYELPQEFSDSSKIVIVKRLVREGLLSSVN